MSDLELARDLIASAARITVLTGAGISTGAGIPDFRGPSGVWTLDPAAERVSTLRDYLADADVRRAAWHRRTTSPALDAQPTDAHRALVPLEHSGRLVGIITQNTDGLHLLAGSSPGLVHEVHGNARTTRCERCGHTQPTTEVAARVDAGEDDPRCRETVGGRECGGILRATTILFGENLDLDVMAAAFDAAERCDVLVAIGSTLSVQPVAGAVPWARAAGAKVVIVNGSPTEYDELAEVRLDGDIQHVGPALFEVSGPRDDG